eukprot:scpid91897/ scgid32283/ 
MACFVCLDTGTLRVWPSILAPPPLLVPIRQYSGLSYKNIKSKSKTGFGGRQRSQCTPEPCNKTHLIFSTPTGAQCKGMCMIKVSRENSFNATPGILVPQGKWI